MKNLMFFISLFILATFAHAKECGCGDKSEGITYEYAIKEDDEKCYDGTAHDTGLILNWKNDGEGNYEMTNSVEKNSSTIQDNCCE